MTSILGISAFYHDSAACLVVDGDIIAAAQEERFSRKKHDAKYPFNAVEYVLSEGNLELSQSEINLIALWIDEGALSEESSDVEGCTDSNAITCDDLLEDEEFVSESEYSSGTSPQDAIIVVINKL